MLAQGSPLSYKQMDLIDKFEYAMRSGADLKSRLTSENMEELMVRAFSGSLVSVGREEYRFFGSKPILFMLCCSMYTAVPC